MEKPKRDEPTFPAPILVGSGSDTDQAVDFLLTVVEWIFREDGWDLQYPVEGAISNWIEQAGQKPIQAGVPAAQAAANRTVERDVLRQSLALSVDPRSDEEKRIATLLSHISSEDAQRLSSALHSNDVKGVQAAQSAIVDKLGKRVTEGITPARAEAFGAMVGRWRAARAAALCVLLYKIDPNVLINSLLKNLVFEVFSFSVLSFRWVAREWFGFFYLPNRLVEATCHVVAIRFRNRHKL